MSESDKNRKLCGKIFSMAGRRQAEAVIISWEEACTRFADNAISQNVVDRGETVGIRLLEKGRSARVWVNRRDDKTLRQAVDAAVEILGRQKSDPNLLLPCAPAPARPAVLRFDKATATCTPAERADMVAMAAARCKAAGQTASGVVSSSASGFVLANSKGVFRQFRQTKADFQLTVKNGGESAFAGACSERMSGIDCRSLCERAMRNARLALKPRAVKPGPYTVILQPDAVHEMLLYLGYCGFDGTQFNEGRSFMSGRLGKRVMGANITLRDNALDGPSAGMPFDFEGMPRRKVTLVEKGIARAVVHDRSSARKAGVQPTGHGLLHPGAFPFNLVLEPGSSSVEKMIKNTRRGLLVTQFHYVNLIKPLTLEITGMTRNGVWLVEDGEVKHAVRNMRFTESVVGALNRVEEIGSAPDLFMGSFGERSLLPALKIADFNFSSATEF